MNSNSILTSNLLDIVFENRNKEYGAYVLRRDYNKRLLTSLITMFALVTMFVVWEMQKSNPTLNVKSFITFPDQIILPPPVFEKQIEVLRTNTQVKFARVSSNPPIIVADILVDDVPPTTLQLHTNVQGDFKDAPPGDESIHDSGNGKTLGVAAGKPITPSKLKEEIEVSPEIPAQYPGGINEFITFLKRNLRSPQDLADDAIITVKVKFIVSLNGDLLGFNVIETGGEVFDNEVIKVLKKMPKWIPGKTNGESVSSYYIVPVKFTPE